MIHFTIKDANNTALYTKILCEEYVFEVPFDLINETNFVEIKDTKGMCILHKLGFLKQTILIQEGNNKLESP